MMTIIIALSFCSLQLSAMEGKASLNERINTDSMAYKKAKDDSYKSNLEIISERSFDESNPIVSEEIAPDLAKSGQKLNPFDPVAVKQWFSTALQSILTSLSHGQRISSQALSQALKKFIGRSKNTNVQQTHF